MKKIIFPQDQNFWYLKRPDVVPLKTNAQTEVLVIGGGMAGLTAAQAFARKGKKVMLIEAYYCGAGASGKSSGFITPNAEISLSEFIERYGVEGGLVIWNSIQKNGVEHIRNNIKRYNLDCDYTQEDALEVASSRKDVVIIQKEADNLARFGYANTFIKKEDIPSVLGSNQYYAGVIYPDSFGINPYKYCQSMKEILQTEGVAIYEETPAIALQDHTVQTLYGTIKADHIIVCADRFIPTLGKLTQEIYHVQNFLLLSQTLSPEIIQKLFPQRRLMVWDTTLIYSFYRLTGHRLLLGGGSLFNIYNTYETHQSNYMYRALTEYAASMFDGLEIQFEQMWPGLIGISKDIAPVAGFDQKQKSIYYIGAVAGLPLAAMLGNYAAEHIVNGDDTLKNYFSPYRKYLIHGWVQKILGRKLTFALSNWFCHGQK